MWHLGKETPTASDLKHNPNEEKKKESEKEKKKEKEKGFRLCLIKSNYGPTGNGSWLKLVRADESPVAWHACSASQACLAVQGFQTETKNQAKETTDGQEIADII